MADTATVTAPPAPTRRRWLRGGESDIAALGGAAAAIIIMMAAASIWWTTRTSEDAVRTARDAQLQATAQVLIRASESLLASDDLSSVRRLMIETARSQELTRCRIMLPGGLDLADADPSQITLPIPLKRWSSGPLDAAPTTTNGSIEVARPILVTGRGQALLELSARPPSDLAHSRDLVGGLSLIGAAGLAILLLVYRAVRRHVMVMGLIRESLLALKAGETARDALAVSPDLGSEAIAWNSLLAEAAKLRGASVAERARGALVRRPEGKSDLESACDSLSVGLILVDQTGRIRHVNGAAAALLQTKREQLVGAEFGKMMDDQKVCLAVAAVCEGAGRRETIELSRGDGVVRVHVRPLRREDGSGSLVTLEDVTQQRVAEASRNAFIAQATHELRAPLTNMRLCLEMALEDDTKDPALLSESFNVLNRETRRLERLVGEMLSVAEIEAGSLTLNMDDVKLDRMFAEIQSDYQAQAEEKQLTMTFDLPPKFPELMADRDRLMLAIHNLVGNATKYTPAGGSVTVTLRADGGKLHVDVADSGIGISEQDAARIFDRFYRAKDPRVSKITGSGLGLALAREVARLHGGDITVQSELNKGSTFTLTVPLKAPGAVAQAA